MKKTSLYLRPQGYASETPVLVASFDEESEAESAAYFLNEASGYNTEFMGGYYPGLCVEDPFTEQAAPCIISPPKSKPDLAWCENQMTVDEA